MSSNNTSNEHGTVGEKTVQEATMVLAGQVFQAVLGAQQVQAAWLGSQLGWYQCLVEKGPLTTTALSTEMATSERYAREWCEHQTVCGWISCVDASAKDREYFLSDPQKAVLTNKDSLTYLLPPCKMVAGLGQHIGKMKEAYKSNTGISWEELGSDARDNMADFSRPMFLQLLGQFYIPNGLPNVHERLSRQGGRVADIGAGCGWSSIGVAQAYPKAHVDCYDLDKSSIEKAKHNIEASGLGDRVKAHCVDVGTLDPGTPSYDLVMALECIHDLSDPVAVLHSMKKLSGTDGTVLVMDFKVQNAFTGDSTNDMEKLNYGFSLICCLADCKSRSNSAETGAVMRPSKLEWYAIEAGFRKVEILPIEHHAYYFYKLS
jgi:2-polyprenyl-3-methyl-5-hydroxy-6-metoxy-1,4-benzoquinol methylase